MVQAVKMERIKELSGSEGCGFWCRYKNAQWTSMGWVFPPAAPSTPPTYAYYLTVILEGKIMTSKDRRPLADIVLNVQGNEWEIKGASVTDPSGDFHVELSRTIPENNWSDVGVSITFDHGETDIDTDPKAIFASGRTINVWSPSGINIRLGHEGSKLIITKETSSVPTIVKELPKSRDELNFIEEDNGTPDALTLERQTFQSTKNAMITAQEEASAAKEEAAAKKREQEQERMMEQSELEHRRRLNSAACKGGILIFHKLDVVAAASILGGAQLAFSDTALLCAARQGCIKDCDDSERCEEASPPLLKNNIYPECDKILETWHQAMGPSEQRSTEGKSSSKTCRADLLMFHKMDVSVAESILNGARLSVNDNALLCATRESCIKDCHDVNKCEEKSPPLLKNNIYPQCESVLSQWRALMGK